jgi:hypothetical protein
LLLLPPSSCKNKQDNDSNVGIAMLMDIANDDDGWYDAATSDTTTSDTNKD